jgi:hypothetical protein
LVAASGLSGIAAFVGQITSSSERGEAYADLAEIALADDDDASAEEFVRASEQAARTIVRPSHHVEALLGLAAGLLNLGDTDRGLSIMLSVASVGGYGKRLLDVLAAVSDDLPIAPVKSILVKVATESKHRISRTDAILGRSEATERAALVRSILEVQSKMDAVGAARTALSEHDPLVRLDVLALISPRLTREQAEALDVASASRIAIGEVMSGRERQLPAGDVKSSNTVSGESTAPMASFSNVVDVLCAVDGHDAAIDLVRTFDGSAWRDEARYGLVKGLVQLGELDLAEAEAQQMVNRTLKSWALGDLVRALGTQGRTDHAASLAQTMTDPIVRGGSEYSVVVQMADAGKLSRATEIARSIGHLPARIEALAHIATLLAKVDKDDARALLMEAESCAKSTEYFWRMEPLGKVANAWASLGDVDRTMHIIRTGILTFDPMNSGFHLIPGLIETGGRQIGEAVADLMERSDRLPGLREEHGILRIADGLVKQGLRARAETLVSSLLNNSWDTSRNLRWLAVSAAQRGDLGRATELAQRAETPAQRASAFAGIAATTTSSVDRRQFLAVAISSDLWTVMSMLANRKPEMHFWLTDQYLALWNNESESYVAISANEASRHCTQGNEDDYLDWDLRDWDLRDPAINSGVRQVAHYMT